MPPSSKKPTNPATVNPTAAAEDSGAGETADLHPSWAAKQKTKVTIQEFTGTKVVFGDDEVSQARSGGSEDAGTASGKNSKERTVKKRKGGNAHQSVGEEKRPAKRGRWKQEDHPSWAARRLAKKMQENKTSIQEFKGSKITFE